MSVYRTIAVDPPWTYRGGLWNRSVSRADAHYPTLTVGEICRLPVPSADDAYLFLWITNRHLLQGHAVPVMDAWGFRPITTMAWCKSMGLGLYIRNSHENIAFGVKGSPGPFNKKDLMSWFDDKRKRHSKKPEGFYTRLEQYVDGPYLEMFARDTRAGWTCWGHDVGDPLGIGFDPAKW